MCLLLLFMNYYFRKLIKMFESAYDNCESVLLIMSKPMIVRHFVTIPCNKI